MEDELSLAEVLDLLEPKAKEKPAQKSYAPPEYTSTYLSTVSKSERCTSRGCGAPTYLLVKEQPYCTVHAIGLLGDLLDEKINHYPWSFGKVETILKAYVEMGAHAPATDAATKRFVVDSEDHKEFIITIGDKVLRYPAYTSPEGVLIQSLLDLIG